MPYNKTYTEAELFLFRQKDKRAIWQSIFSSLCTLGNSLWATQTTEELLKMIKGKTTEIVKELEEQYPTEETAKTPEYKEGELDKKITETEQALENLKKIKSGLPF